MDALAIDRSIGLNKEARYLNFEAKRIMNGIIGSSIYEEQIALKNLLSFLKATWLEETINHSSPTDIFTNRYYLRIINLGPFLINCILEDLSTSPNYWFEALSKITGEDPVPDSHYGDVNAMAQDWLNWGKENQLI